jgi:hypothetical protein
MSTHRVSYDPGASDVDGNIDISGTPNVLQAYPTYDT